MGLLDRVRRMLPPSTGEAPQVVSTADIIDDPTKLTRSARGLVSDLYASTSALVNAFTGAGTSRDPSSYNQWAMPRSLGVGQRFGMGRNALIGQALGKLPNTATREGWRIAITDERVEDKEGVADQITAYESRLGIGMLSARAMFRGRQYGDAFVFLGVDDGRPFDQPVDWTAVKTIRWAAVIDKRDYNAHRLYQATSPNFGRVEVFEITDINGLLEDGLRYGDDSISYPYNAIEAALNQESSGRLLVHADRILHFPTTDHFSVLDTLQDSLGGYFTSMNGISTAAREASTVVYKVTNWIRKSWGENSALAQAHLAFTDKAKSVLNAWVVDKENEEVDIKNRSLAGVSQLADPFMVWMSAALDMPVTELWGVSPGGFGKGESEREKWHESVRAFQRNSLAPQLTHVHALILVAEDGCQLPRDIERTIGFEDLSPPDEQTRSELRSAALSDLRQLVKDDIISRAEARPAIAALSDDYFRPDIDLDATDDAKTAQVGVFTASIALMQALYPTGVPVEAGRELMLALASTFFTPENVGRIFPERGAPATGTATGGDPSAPDIEDDEAGAEPSEVELAWSQNPIPTDAMEAKEIAAELDIPTVRVTRAHRAELIEGWNILGGKPRYSLEAVRRVVLQGNGKMPSEEAAAAADAAATEETIEDAKSIFIMLRLPPEIALWVPYKEKDTSPPHVTLLYVPNVLPSEVDDVLAELALTFDDLEPFDVQLGAVGYFEIEHVKYARVAYASALFSVDEQALFDDLADAIDSFGFVASRHDRFTPHVSLAYLAEATEPYAGPVPQGGWQATTAEVWYGHEPVAVFTFGGLYDDEPDSSPARDKVTPLPGDPVEAGEGEGGEEPGAAAEVKEQYAWVWRTQRDGRVRTGHRKLEGRKFKKGEKDPDHGEPGEDDNCRCAKQYLPARDTKRAQRASERTVRRALRRNWKRVTGEAIKRQAKAQKPAP